MLVLKIRLLLVRCCVKMFVIVVLCMVLFVRGLDKKFFWVILICINVLWDLKIGVLIMFIFEVRLYVLMLGFVSLVEGEWEDDVSNSVLFICLWEVFIGFDVCER